MTRPISRGQCGTVAETEIEEYKDFSESEYVKLLLVFAVDSNTAREFTVTSFIEVEMSSSFLRAIKADRVRVREFKVVGE